jgi:DNA replication protein DnaC
MEPTVEENQNQHLATGSITTPTPPESEWNEERLIRLQSQLRADQGIVDQPEPGDVKTPLQKICDRIMAAPLKSEDEIAEIRSRELMAERQSMIGDLVRLMGRRYAKSRLSEFEIYGDPAEQKRQQTAIETLKSLAINIRQHVETGGNVILHGPPGTGKDHLMAAVLLKTVFDHGYRVQWVNGQDLFGDFRDRIDSNRSEENLVGRYTEAQILAISDPAPPRGDASNYNAQMLYRIVDRRYRQCLGTWITVNVGTEQEARECLSAPVFDRLMDNSLRVFCNWPSYRKARRPAWS